MQNYKAVIVVNSDIVQRLTATEKLYCHQQNVIESTLVSYITMAQVQITHSKHPLHMEIYGKLEFEGIYFMFFIFN